MAIWQRSNGMYQLTTLGSSTVRFNFPAMNGEKGRLEATVNLADGNWHFLAATFDNGTHQARLYDNGRFLNGKTVKASIAADQRPDEHLRRYAAAAVHTILTADVGELLIYKRAVSAGQIAKLYTEAGGDRDNQDKAGLVAGYHFDEGRGTTVADFSGHGNDGTLHGGVKWVSGRASAVPHAGALQFDGTRYATLPQSTKFTAGDFTISLWFNPAEVRGHPVPLHARLRLARSAGRYRPDDQSP